MAGAHEPPGVLQNDPGSIDNQFSLAELLTLGGMPPGLDGWGSSGLLSFGCMCTRFPDPRTWRILAGRPQLAMMAASTVEMNLEMAQRLAALRLPAALLPSVLATAMQDSWTRRNTADPNDRDGSMQYARSIGRNIVNDYVAAAAALDGPLVLADLADATEP